MSTVENRRTPQTAPSAQHARTAADAVQQADEKERLQTAAALRSAGIPTMAAGLLLLLRHSTSARSFSELLGILLVVLGPVAYIVGAILLRRAVARTRVNPVTAEIVGEEKT